MAAPGPRGGGVRLDRTNALRLLGGLMIVAGTWLIRPFTYLTRNHSLQLPLVQARRDPGLFPGDPFVDALSSYASLYWSAVARIEAIPTEVTLGILYAVTLIGGLAAAAWLARALAPQSRIAPWAGALVFGLGITPFIGQGTIVRDFAEHTTLAVVFLMLAFAALAARRPWLTAVFYATGFLMNQMYGIHVALYLGLFLIAAGAGGLLDRRWGFAAVLAGALIAPGLIWSQRASSALSFTGPEQAETWAAVLRHIGGPHFYPHLSSWEGWVALAVLLAAVIAVAVRDENHWRRALVISAALAVVLWIGIGFQLAYFMAPSKALLLHAMRAGDLFYVLGLLYLLGGFCASLERNSEAGLAAGLLPVAGIAALLLLYGLVHPLLAAALLLPATIPWVRSRLSRLNATEAGVVLAAGLLVYGGAQMALRPPEKRGLVRVGASGAVREAAAWAEHNTPGDATFMVNPVPVPDEHAMFRPLSHRPLFLACKDGTASHWSVEYMRHYLERMDALGMVRDFDPLSILSEDEIEVQWARTTDEDLLPVAREYEIDYAVFERDRPTQLPTVFVNEGYRIVRFPSSEAPTAGNSP
jgi:hypothetical protein